MSLGYSQSYSSLCSIGSDTSTTSLDIHDREQHKEYGAFKFLGGDRRANIVAELKSDQTKLDKFRNWLSHAFGRITERDILKTSGSIKFVDMVKSDIDRDFAHFSPSFKNDLINYVVSNATHGKVVVHDVANGVGMDIQHTTKYPHAISSEEVTCANALLHSIKEQGLDYNSLHQSMVATSQDY